MRRSRTFNTTEFIFRTLTKDGRRRFRRSEIETLIQKHVAGDKRYVEKYLKLLVKFGFMEVRSFGIFIAKEEAR